MSQAISNKVLVQSAKYCWMICDYSMSGSTLSYTLSFKYEGGCAQLDNAYIKYKNGSDIWRNSGRVHNYEGNPLASGHTVSIHSGTVAISGSQTIQFGITKYSGVSCVGEFTVSGVSAPSGLSCTVNSVAWNKVNGTFAVSNWGGEPTGSSKYIAGRLFSATSSARREEYQSNVNSITKDITTNSVAFDGGIEVKGAGSYRIDTYASNSVGSSTTSMQNVYTPPAPLASLTYTQTQQSTNVKVDVSITGGNSTDNYGNTVTTYWRYSTNGGSSWSGWGNAGTGTPWTTKTASFTCNYGASVKVQAKQTYQNKDSAVKEVSFTATNGTAPSSLSSSITASTWNSVTMSGSCSYGNPSGISGRGLTVGVNINGSSLANRRELRTNNVTSVSSVVINNSSSNLGGDFTLKGMLPVYPYAWASNTIRESSTIGSAYYLPPAPGQLSYTLDSETVTHKDYTVSYVGIAANNVTGYTASDLKRTVRYSENDGATWTYVDNDVQKSLTATTSFQVSIAAQHNVIVQSWLSYKGKNSDVSAVVISNNADPIYFYGGVSERDPVTQEWGDPVSKRITKMYGSFTGLTHADALVHLDDTIIDTASFEGSKFIGMVNHNPVLVSFIKDGEEILSVNVSGADGDWRVWIDIDNGGTSHEYVLGEELGEGEMMALLAPWGVHFVNDFPNGTDSMELIVDSVVEESVKITKLYGSVNGVAREFFEDV